MMEEQVDYTNAALIVWDMQYGIASRAFNFKEIVPKIKLLIEEMHTAGMPVIYSQHTGLPYEYMSKYNIYSAKKRGMDPKASIFMARGSQEWQIVSELTPAKQDIVLEKHTPSFLIGTILEQILRAKNIDTLILVGVSTEAGIEGSSRHLAYSGYIPVVVEDAVGSFEKEVRDAALMIMRRMFEVQTTDVVVSSIKKLKKK